MFNFNVTEWYTCTSHYSCYDSYLNNYIYRGPGADPGFSFRGAQKSTCVRTHITSAEPNSLSAGVCGPTFKQGPGSSRVGYMYNVHVCMHSHAI